MRQRSLAQAYLIFRKRRSTFPFLFLYCIPKNLKVAVTLSLVYRHNRNYGEAALPTCIHSSIPFVYLPARYEFDSIFFNYIYLLCTFMDT